MTLRTTLDAWRARTAPTVQALWALGALAVAAALAWALVLDPLTRDLAATQDTLDEVRATLVQARRHTEAVPAVGATPPGPAAADTRGAVERAIAQHGLRPALTALQVRERRVEVTFEAIDFAALTRLVDVLAREAQLFPVDTLLAARSTPGSVRAEIAFAP